MSIKQIEFLAKNNLVKNLKIDKDATHSINCKTCDAAKLSRKKFAKFKNRATTEIGEVIHSDVCGPISPMSIGQNRYFVTFTDDFSK
jgi:hypothetical protein